MPANKKKLKLNRNANKKRLILVVLSVALMGVALLAQSLAFRTIGNGTGDFNAYCDFSHRSNDDPIVFPGQTGAAHSHDFFGARNLNAFSTTQSIQQGGTSCHRIEDKSAYWVPTLYVNDQPIQPNRLTAQYKADYRMVREIKPFPAGLKVIAGNSAGGPSEASPGHSIWYFMCHLSPTLVKGSATSAPTCEYHTKNNARLQLIIRFPECWDGINLDSSNHKSHLAYAVWVSDVPHLDGCPKSHPVQVPSLQVILEYPTTGGPTTRLSSGAINTAHADFMNGWPQDHLAMLVKNCLNIDNYCGGGDVPVPGHAGNEPDPPSTVAATGTTAPLAGTSRNAATGGTASGGNNTNDGGSATSGGSTASGRPGDPASASYSEAELADSPTKIKLNPVQAVINRINTPATSTFYKVAFLIGLVCLTAALLNGRLTTPVIKRLLSRLTR